MWREYDIYLLNSRHLSARQRWNSNYTLGEFTRFRKRFTHVTHFSDGFIRQITCIRANDAVDKKESSVQKQRVLSGLEKNQRKTCRHAPAGASKAFSLQGKYLKANIQLTLLLLQTPVTDGCTILACRVVQPHADRCLDKNIFLYSRQDAFWRKRSSTVLLILTLLIRELLKSWDLLANSLAVGLAPLRCRQLALLALISYFDFSGVLFFIIFLKSSKSQSIIYHGFKIFLCKYHQRHWKSIRQFKQASKNWIDVWWQQSQNVQILIHVSQPKEKIKV